MEVATILTFRIIIVIDINCAISLDSSFDKIEDVDLTAKAKLGTLIKLVMKSKLEQKLVCHFIYANL